MSTFGKPMTVEGSTVEGYAAILGMLHPDQRSFVRRSRLKGVYGMIAYDGRSLVEDVLVEGLQGATDDMALGTATYGGLSSEMVVRHATMIGKGTNGSRAVVASSTRADGVVSVLVENSIAVGFQHGFGRAAKFYGRADMSGSFNHFESSDLEDLDGTGSGAIVVDHPVPGKATFTPGWRLPSDSPFIDKGAPGVLGADESTTDLDGGARLLAGRAGDVARRDLGAYEAPTGPGPQGPVIVVSDPEPAKGETPPLVLPPAPPVTLTLGGAKRQKLGRSVAVKVRANVAAAAVAGAKVKLAGARKTIALGTARGPVTPATTRTLRLRVSTKAAATLRKALEAGRKATATITVKVTTADGRTATAKRAVRVTR